VSEKEALQSAADEARKAARGAREFAGILDDYAKYLTQPTFRQRADDLHLSALHKLRVVNDGLAACNRWVEESGSSAVAPSLKQTVQRKVSGKQDVPEETTPPAERIAKKGGKR
jgi:hypothetical protein